MRAFGYLKQFPVWVDQHDRVLSGRHRIKAAELVGIQYQTLQIEVESDLDALAIAYAANENTGFLKADRERFAKRLSAAGLDIENIGKVIGRAGKRLSDPSKVARRSDAIWSLDCEGIRCA